MTDALQRAKEYFEGRAREYEAFAGTALDWPRAAPMRSRELAIGAAEAHREHARAIGEAIEERERYRAALSGLVAAVDATDRATVGLFSMAYLHGVTYSGPTHCDAMLVARRALSGPHTNESEK